METENKGEIIIYKDKSGPELKVKVEDETVWLSQGEISKLFGTDRSSITKHLRNIVKSGELPEKGNVQNLHIAGSDKPVKYYNLDFILSVGYRVNSSRATQFRVWATQKLRDLLLKGFVIHEERLKKYEGKIRELAEAERIFRQALESRRTEGYEKDLLNIITDYLNTWSILNEYDAGTLDTDKVSSRSAVYIAYGQAKDAIRQFKERLIASSQASDLFGREVSNKLNAIFGSIKQSANGREVYESIEEKAAHLFYFIVKDHPFVDGNKRIACLLLLLFLIENHMLYNRKGERKFNDAALAALALLVAESKPSQKSVMIKLIVNLVNKK